MNKKIIFGVMLSCFLLLVTPCINAVEYKEVKENTNSIIVNIFEKLGILSSIIPLLIVYYIICYFISFFLLATYYPSWAQMYTLFEAFILSFGFAFVVMSNLPLYLLDFIIDILTPQNILMIT